MSDPTDLAAKKKDDKALAKRLAACRQAFEDFMGRPRSSKPNIEAERADAEWIVHGLCEPLALGKDIQSPWCEPPWSAKPGGDAWRGVMMSLALLGRSAHGDGAMGPATELARRWGADLAKHAISAAHGGLSAHAAKALEGPPREALDFAWACAALCAQRPLDLQQAMAGREDARATLSNLVGFVSLAAMAMGEERVAPERRPLASSPEGALAKACARRRSALALDAKGGPGFGGSSGWLFDPHARSSLGSGALDIWREGSRRTPLASAIVASLAPHSRSMARLLARAESEGALGPGPWGGRPWAGAHPLALLARPMDLDGAHCEEAMEILGRAGYKADWTLPVGFEGRALNPASSEPNFLLQWARSNAHALTKAARISAADGVDFQQRNQRGETAVGALNRRARRGTPDSREALALAQSRGDPEDLRATKSVDALAATPAIAAIVRAERERRELEQGIDAVLWESCLLQARGEAEAARPKEPPKPKARL